MKYDKLYDHYILGKTAAHKEKLERRENRRRGTVNRKSAKGKTRGEKRASESKDNFERTTNRLVFFDFVVVILEGFLDLFS